MADSSIKCFMRMARALLIFVLVLLLGCTATVTTSSLPEGADGNLNYFEVTRNRVDPSLWYSEYEFSTNTMPVRFATRERQYKKEIYSAGYDTRNLGFFEYIHTLLYGLSLGIIPACEVKESSTTLTAYTPVGDTTGTFSRTCYQFKGWVMYLKLFESLAKDDGASVLESEAKRRLVSRFYDKWDAQAVANLNKVNTLKRISHTEDWNDSWLTGSMQLDKREEVRLAASNRVAVLTRNKKIAEIATSRDGEYLARVAQSDGHDHVRLAASNRIAVLTRKKIAEIDASCDGEYLSRVVRDDGCDDVRLAASNRISVLVRMKIASSRDEAWLRSIYDKTLQDATLSVVNDQELRAAALNRLEEIANARRKNREDVEKLLGDEEWQRALALCDTKDCGDDSEFRKRIEAIRVAKKKESVLKLIESRDFDSAIRSCQGEKGFEELLQKAEALKKEDILARERRRKEELNAQVRDSERRMKSIAEENELNSIRARKNFKPIPVTLKVTVVGVQKNPYYKSPGDLDREIEFKARRLASSIDGEARRRTRNLEADSAEGLLALAVMNSEFGQFVSFNAAKGEVEAQMRKDQVVEKNGHKYCATARWNGAELKIVFLPNFSNESILSLNKGDQIYVRGYVDSIDEVGSVLRRCYQMEKCPSDQ